MLNLNLKKTYVVAILAAVVTGLKYAGFLTEDTYQLLMGLLASGGIATVRAAISKIDNRL